MKEIYSTPVGGDGGKITLGADAGQLKLEVGFPLVKIVEPIVKKLKDVLPGTKFDHYADDIAALIFKAMGVEEPAKDEPAAPAEEVPATEVQG